LISDIGSPETVLMLLYSDPIFLEHNTGQHPESAERILPAIRQLQSIGRTFQCGWPTWQPISLERLARVHALEYIQQVKAFAAAGGGRIEEDTVVSERSYDVALMAAGAVCNAVERVLAGEAQQAFCLVRPPGHHVLIDHAMGFGLFNNVALGARLAIDELGLDRVLIVDWDVHHGNGTQATFWEEGHVGYLSIHRWPFYPGTGAADETGAGDGLGATLNLPVTFGASRQEYLARFSVAVEKFSETIKPQLVLISAGFDSHHKDPIGSLGLESEDFAALTRTVMDMAATWAQGRVISVLEGGYHPAAVAESVEYHLHEMLSV
jgi:acetoin utilization deacetylase AcuC-like enzyme